jgi:hypothetical protein
MRRVDLDRAHALCLGFGDILRDAPIMALVDDRAVIRVLRQRRIEFARRLRGERDEFIEPLLR